MVLAIDSKCHKLFVVQLLDSRRRLSPNVKVDEQDAIGERVDDERLHGFSKVGEFDEDNNLTYIEQSFSNEMVELVGLK